MITPKQKEILWVFDLVSQQETDGLQRLSSSIHVVSKEQVVGLRWESSILKQSE